MSTKNFDDIVDSILDEDSRYDGDAYVFVKAALDHTARTRRQPVETGKQHHVTARELLDGVRRFCLQEFGPMSRRVLSEWGVNCTADIGEIVFNLVEKDFLGKTESDKREDFKDVYDFEEAFVRPFLPAHRMVKTMRVRRDRGRRPASPL